MKQQHYKYTTSRAPLRITIAGLNNTQSGVAGLTQATQTLLNPSKRVALQIPFTQIQHTQAGLTNTQTQLNPSRRAALRIPFTQIKLTLTRPNRTQPSQKALYYTPSKHFIPVFLPLNTVICHSMYYALYSTY